MIATLGQNMQKCQPSASQTKHGHSPQLLESRVSYVYIYGHVMFGFNLVILASPNKLARLMSLNV